MNEQSRETLQVTSSILLRCWVLGFCLMLFTFVTVQFLSEPIYSIHGKLFGLNVDELNNLA